MWKNYYRNLNVPPDSNTEEDKDGAPEHDGKRNNCPGKAAQETSHQGHSASATPPLHVPDAKRKVGGKQTVNTRWKMCWDKNTVPRRVFTLSQIKYVIDRLVWLNENRELIGGLKFVYEPAVLRFFMGRLEPVSDCPQKLIARFREDFGDSL